MKVVVDTSVWIDWLRDLRTEETGRLSDIVDKDELLLGDLVLLEILQGARDEGHAGRLERLLRRFTIVNMLNVDIAVAAAAHFRFLRSRGVTVRKTPDLIIGAYCLDQGCALLHSDRDYQPMVEHLGLRQW
ncbi:PIN domain-containing protein [Rhizobium sp. G21]|uniref:type II toxin-antitoxin system VapC family toxin n=1 Tax=Rhizobium sp. G21 TaxID=2758439 RepID=UPI0016017B1F|nr:PIN domain-containing protein [Rhizobium sp. G21]MBB1250370.1 PIN domain-containing protein [Rhizobium sp. G21]